MPEQDAAAQRRKKWLGIATALFMAVLLAIAIRHVLSEVKFEDVWAYLQALPYTRLLQAVGITALGYWVLTLYDVSALIYLKKKVPYRTTAFAAACGYAFSNNIGWAVLSGAGVRLRTYGAAGLTPADVARVVVFSTTTFTLGISFTGAVGVLVGPHPVATMLKVPELLVQGLAVLTLLVLASLCIITGVTRKPIKLWRWSIQLPSPLGVISQIGIGSLEIVLAAGVLWSLLPLEHGIGFTAYLGIYCAALVVAIFSHVPGGIGVFESIIILGLSDDIPAGQLLGAMLAYRFVYYILPLLLAGIAIAIWEIRHHTGRIGRAADRLRGHGEPPSAP